MTIAQIIASGRGTAGAWRVHRDVLYWQGEPLDAVCSLWHYSTEMLRWRESDPNDANYLDYCTGCGSFSDQNGMNTAFRTLGIPLHFSRAGGASIDSTERGGS